MSVLLMVIAVGLLVVIGLVLKPSGLKKIEGYPGELITDNPRNLLAEVQALLRPDVSGKTLTFTEAEVNRYLNERIKGRQKGPVSAVVKFQGVYVDLAPTYAEFYVVRSAFGLPFAISTRIELQKGQYQNRWRTKGGTIGGFRLSDKQFTPIVAVFLRLKDTCADELTAIRAIGDNGIEFGDNQITFKK